MTTTNRWVAGAVAVALALVAASWFLLISPQRSQAAELREQAVAQQASNDVIRLRTQQLKAQFASLPQRRAELAEIRQQLPATPMLSTLLRQLQAVADEAGVGVDSIAPERPQALASGAAAGAAAGAPAGASTDSSAVQSIATTMVVKGGYAELTLFLQKVQGSMRRAVLVENLTLVPAQTTGSTSDTQLTMTLTGKVFVLGTGATGTGAASGAGTTPSTGTGTSTTTGADAAPATPTTSN
jgi:Tfp pilus assembly protein PilO